MLFGTLILGDSTAKNFTSWMPRVADNAIFSYEIVHTYHPTVSEPFTIKVFHKNREEMGPGTDASATWTTDGTTKRAIVGELKELVRYEIDCPAANIGGVYRLFPPTWFDSAEYP